MELTPAQRAARYEMLSKIDRTSSFSSGELARTGLDIANVTFPMSAEILMQSVTMKAGLRTRRERIDRDSQNRVRSAADVIRIYRDRLAETRKAYRHKLIGEIVPADIWTEDEDRIPQDLQVSGFNKPITVPSWIIFDALLNQDEADVLEALKASQPRNVAGRLKHEIADAELPKMYDALQPLEVEITAFEKKHKIESSHYAALVQLIHFNEASIGGRCDATGAVSKDRTLCNFLADLDAGASEPYCTARHFKPDGSHKLAFNSNSQTYHFSR